MSVRTGRRGGAGGEGSRLQPARRLCVGASGWGPSAHQRHVNVAKTHVHGDARPSAGLSLKFSTPSAAPKPPTNLPAEVLKSLPATNSIVSKRPASAPAPTLAPPAGGGFTLSAAGDANHASQCSSTACSNHGARPTSYIHGSVDAQSVPCNRGECAGGRHAPRSSCG